MNYAAIGIPDFALQALLRLEGQKPLHPLVVMTDDSRRARALQMTPAAARSAVEPGMTPPQVLARCPEALIRPRRPDCEEAAAQALLSCARMFAPRVEVTSAGLCTIDLEGVLPEHRKRRPAEILDQLSQFGLEGRIGIARTPALAQLACGEANPILEVTCEETFIRNIPLAAADLSPHLESLLRHWGLTTLGTFGRLSRQAVGERLGKEGVALWDRIKGRDSRLLQPAPLQQTFEESIEFETGIETLEPLLFYLRRFADQLALRLKTAHRAAEGIELELAREHTFPLLRSFRLPEATTRAEILFRMLETCLHSLKTNQRLTGFRLRAIPGRIQAKQRELFNSAVKDPHQLAETLARLCAAGNSVRAGSPRPSPTHRPDAFVMDSLKEEETNGLGPLLPPLPGLALRRFRPPVSAQVLTRQGNPVSVRSGILDGTVRRARGPWLLSGDWWQEERWSREEWDIEMQGTGLYRLVREKRMWFVEGMYD